MAGKEDKDKGVQRAFDPDQRFKYLGFEIHPGKIGSIFKSDSERDGWISKVRQKREKSTRVREHNTLEEARVAPFEKIVLTVTSVLLIASLFFPWFSGYREIEVVDQPEVVQQPAAVPVDSLMAEGMTDSTAVAGVTETMDSTGVEVATQPEEVVLEKDEAGFSSIMATTQRKEYRKEHEQVSALGAVASLGTFGGAVFSSGFILMLTGVLMILYMLFCIGYAGYALYTLYAAKGSEDEKALRLKKTLRLAWLPIVVYFLCIILSVVGADYSFTATDQMVKQIGTSYGTGTYLGLLSYGFYMTLACFALNGAKGVEI
jgi:hypothetical protein